MSKTGKPKRKTHADIRIDERVLERKGMRETMNEKQRGLLHAVSHGKLSADAASAAGNIITSMVEEMEQGLHRMDITEGKTP